MAALLVALAVMAILMSVAMPVWRQQARREKEAELVWRGEQYARAIALYNFKMQQQGRGAGMNLPPSIDFLVEQRYLRRKYKDPMTKDGEFVVIPANMGQQQPGLPTPGQQQPGPSAFPPPAAGGIGQRGPTPPPGGGSSPIAIGGVMGVRSKSEETSLRSYRGQTRYDQWLFTFNTVPRPGGMAPAATTPDGRGGPNAPGGRRGNPPFGSPGIGNPGMGGQGGRGNQPRGGPGGGTVPGGIDPRSGPAFPGRAGRGPGL